MNFTGVLYGRPNEWVIILEGDYFRYQELYKADELDWTQGQMYKIFGKQKFKKIIESLKDFTGKIRDFEIDNERLTVVGLSFHCDGKIHKTGYEEILWENNKKSQ